MKNVFLAVCVVVVLICSCHNDKQQVQSSKTSSFEIPGTVEETKEKFPNGTHKISIFTDEKTHRKIAEVEFHPNGQPKIDKRFVNDTLNGESWCYYEDAKPWSLNSFKNGLNDGPYKTWHPNGQLYIDGQYVNGLEEGEWFTYYPTGVLNTRGSYINGKKSGVWISYNKEGTLRREQDFDHPESK